MQRGKLNQSKHVPGLGTRTLLCALLLWFAPSLVCAEVDQAKIEQAQDAALEGWSHFKAKRFREAFNAYERAHGFFPQDNYLLAMAKALDQLPENCAEGVAAWRRYLETCVDCKRKAVAIAGLEANAKRCARQPDDSASGASLAADDGPRDLAVSTTPSGVEIFVDGAADALGVTPTTLELPPGQHQLVLRKAGFEDQTLSLKVLAGENPGIERTMVVAAPMDTQLWGWSAVGAGGGAALLGTYFLTSAISERDGAPQLPPEGITEAFERDHAQGKEDFESNMTLTWVSYGLGAALVTTGIILLKGEAKTAPSSAQGQHPMPAWSWSF